MKDEGRPKTESTGEALLIHPSSFLPHPLHVRILDLDDGVARQERLRQRAESCLSLRAWGPRLRMACSWKTFARFEEDLSRQLGPTEARPCLTFVGSGDFHHVSLALCRRQRRPCNLLVLDNHPDWMRRVPFLHCGTWLYHAAGLPQVHRVFHVGGEVDFDNHYRWLAPWRMLRSGKISVLPAVRSFRGKAWRGVGCPALRESPAVPATRDAVEALLRPWRLDLARLPLYVSLDRDVMQVAEAVVNWDSGRLLADEVLIVITAFLAASAGPAGMDVVGDWSPVRVEGWLRKFLHWTEHPRLVVDPRRAQEVNEGLNLRLVDAVALAEKGSVAPAKAA
jgi:hypothetical protein